MLRYAPLLALTALAACAPAGDMPQGPGEPPAAYMAPGNEPGWTLEITPSRLNYDGDYGETKIMVPNPGAMHGHDGERYVTDRLKVDVARGECSAGMRDSVRRGVV